MRRYRRELRNRSGEPEPEDKPRTALELIDDSILQFVSGLHYEGFPKFKTLICLGRLSELRLEVQRLLLRFERLENIAYSCVEASPAPGVD
jgi:hypothetical protein